MEYVALGKLCDVRDGTHDSPKYVNAGYPLVTSKNVSSGKIDFSDCNYISEEDFVKINKRSKVDVGDIIMPMIGTVGQPVVVDMDVDFAIKNVALIKFQPDSKVTNEYIALLLNSPYFDRVVLSKVRGGTQKFISLKDIREFPIPLVSLDRQNFIVKTLKNVKSIVDMRFTELQKLDELIKARFVEMFGDPTTNDKHFPVKALPEIAEYWNGLTYKPENVSAEGTIVLRSSNIQNAQLDFTDTVRVNCKIPDKKYVAENDILMCSRNGSARLVGKVALIKNIEESMSFGAFMMIIRSDYYHYLMTYFQMPAFRAQIVTGATTTINQITGAMLDKVKLPIPEMELIEEFADFVQQVDKSKVVVQEALDKAQLLFDSLMQEYFG